MKKRNYSLKFAGKRLPIRTLELGKGFKRSRNTVYITPKVSVGRMREIAYELDAMDAGGRDLGGIFEAEARNVQDLEGNSSMNGRLRSTISTGSILYSR